MIRTTVVACLVAGVACMQAHAVDRDRSETFNGTAHCQGALPNFEGQLRKRPLGIQNEGVTPAFVTCAFPANGRILGLQVTFGSTLPNDITISCTAVLGRQIGGGTYATRSIVVDANDAGLVDFVPSAFGGSGVFPWGQLGMSCQLPPGIGINDIYLVYREDVGA